jgi:hypothetical protein
MPKTLCEHDYRTDFCCGSVWQQRIFGGGGGSVRKQLSQQFTCPYKDSYKSRVCTKVESVQKESLYKRRVCTKGESVQKESLLLAHSCEERYSRQVAEGQKAQFGLGFSALMPHGAHSLNCCIEKG